MDILTAAQKQIDDAAKQSGGSPPPVGPPPQTPSGTTATDTKQPLLKEEAILPSPAGQNAAIKDTNEPHQGSSLHATQSPPAPPPAAPPPPEPPPPSVVPPEPIRQTSSQPEADETPVNLDALMVDTQPQQDLETSEAPLPQASEPPAGQEPSPDSTTTPPLPEAITESKKSQSKLKQVGSIVSFFFLIIGLGVATKYVIIDPGFGTFDIRRYAADNLCNVNRTCATKEEWEKGWYDARRPENIGAVPTRDEYTSANPENDPRKGRTQRVEIIRKAGEINEIMRSDIAAADAARRGGDVVNPSTRTDPALPALEPEGALPASSGDAASCWGLGGGSNNETERACLVNATSGLYTSDACRGKTIEQCAALGTATYCTGPQQTSGDQTGEFLDCGKASTGGCGQVDVRDASDKMIGFAIDKTGCSKAQAAPPPPADKTTPTPEKKSKPPSGPRCERIKIYKDNIEVKDFSTLKPGEKVQIAVAGRREDRARFRVDGGAFVETSTTNKNGEYIFDFTIPDKTTFTIEAEVHRGTKWQ